MSQVPPLHIPHAPAPTALRSYANLQQQPTRLWSDLGASLKPEASLELHFFDTRFGTMQENVIPSNISDAQDCKDLPVIVARSRDGCTVCYHVVETIHKKI